MKSAGYAILFVCSFLVFQEAAVWGAPGVDHPILEIETPATVCGHETIVLIIDPLLVSEIRENLNQFEADLCGDGYNVIKNSTAFVNPLELRNYLLQLFEHPEIDLAGAILIGDIPNAYQWVKLVYSNPDLVPVEEEVISYQYYADLNGNFLKTADFESTGGHEYSFNVHDGDVDWEIWVGVLPYYKADLGTTVNALKRYFAKNHAFRHGVLRRPDVFLQISELLSNVEQLRSGQYVWAPYANMDNALLYAGNVSGGYTNLEAGMAEITVVDAHGYWGASGQLSIADVESNPVRTILFWSNGCAIGNLDYENNFLTSILYSETSEVLVAKGTTNDSGGMGTNENGFFGQNIATALSMGASLGEAILSHVNVPLIHPWSDSREFHMATSVVLGDPTLKFELTADFEINSGLNDAWYNPATNGQGLLLTVFPDIRQIFVAWFTFDSVRPPKGVNALLGGPGQRWLTAQGTFEGDTANLTIFVTEGGVFDAAEPAVTTDPSGDGAMTIEFADCANGLVSYEITSLGLSGEIPIQRITLDNVSLCETLSGQ